MSLVLYSDGGGTKESSAAGACILASSNELEFKFIIYLGEATNNEAEISAGLLGFAILSSGVVSSLKNIKELTWVSDSEYSLKSATAYIFNWQKNGWKTSQKKPVKNQGLWKSYLQLTSGVKVNASHVKGHAGHRENELCDQASTFAQANAETILSVSGPTYIENSSGLEDNWYLLDGRKFLEKLRNEEVEEGLSILNNQILNLFSVSDLVSSPVKDVGHKEPKMREVTKDLEKKVLNFFDTVPESLEVNSLKEEVLKVIKRHSVEKSALKTLPF